MKIRQTQPFLDITQNIPVQIEKKQAKHYEMLLEKIPNCFLRPIIDPEKYRGL